MKKLIVGLVLLMAVQVWAQEKTKITVKSTEKNNGVVFVTIKDGAKSVDLNCNEGFPNCTAPKAGEYWMVTLPKNRGVHECKT